MLLGQQGTKVLLALGSYMGRRLGRQFLATVGPYFAAEGLFGSVIGGRMNKMKGFFGRWGGKLGVAFVAGLVTFGLSDANTRQSLIDFGKNIGTYIVEGIEWLVNKGLSLIEGVLDEANVFAIAGVDAPDFGDVNIDPDSLLDTNWRYGPQANSQQRDEGRADDPFGLKPRSPKPRKPSAGASGRQGISLFRPGRIEVPVYLDKRQIAIAVADEAEIAAALR